MSRSVRKEKDSVQVQDEVQEEAEESHNDAIPVDKLQASGINAGDITKLKAAGLYTIMGVLMRPKKDLTQIKGLSEAKIDKIVEACNKHVSFFSFITGADYAMKRQKVVRFSTGCKSVDELLGGGVESQSITEIYGEFRSGKTQLCHMLCVTCQLPYDQGGVAGKAVYIDSEGTFRPERIMKIAERYGMDPETAMENILFARAYTHEHQDALITLAAAKMCEEKFGVLIIDSITSLFRVDFSGRGELAARQQALAQTLSKLIKVASEFNVAVVMTNQVMADPGGGMTFVQDVKKPIGGHVLAHASTTRLYVRKGKGDQRCLKVVDSPMLAEAETTFRITENGIEEGDGDVA